MKVKVNGYFSGEAIKISAIFFFSSLAMKSTGMKSNMVAFVFFFYD